MNIHSVTVVTQAGVKTYEVDGIVNDKKIAFIREEFRLTNGDSFQHYCIYDSDNNMLASVDKLCPCDVVYS